MDILSKRFLKIFIVLLLVETLILALMLTTYEITENDITIETSVIPHSYKPRIEFLGRGETIRKLVLVNESLEEIYATRNKLIFKYYLNLPLNFDGNITVELSLKTVYELDKITISLIGYHHELREDITIYSITFGSLKNREIIDINHTISLKDYIDRMDGSSSPLRLEIGIYGYKIVVRIDRIKVSISANREIAELLMILADAYGEYIYSERNFDSLEDIILRLMPHVMVSIHGFAFFRFYNPNYSLMRVVGLLEWHIDTNNVTGTPIYICVGDKLDLEIDLSVGKQRSRVQLMRIDFRESIPKYLKIWLPIYYLNSRIIGQCKGYIEVMNYDYSYYLIGELEDLKEISNRPKLVPIVPGEYFLTIYIRKGGLRRGAFKLQYFLNFSEYGEPVLKITSNLFDFFGIVLPPYLFAFLLTYIVEWVIYLVLINVFIWRSLLGEV